MDSAGRGVLLFLEKENFDKLNFDKLNFYRLHFDELNMIEEVPALRLFQQILFPRILKRLYKGNSKLTKRWDFLSCYSIENFEPELYSYRCQ